MMIMDTKWPDLGTWDCSHSNILQVNEMVWMDLDVRQLLFVDCKFFKRDVL